MIVEFNGNGIKGKMDFDEYEVGDDFVTQFFTYGRPGTNAYVVIRDDGK